MDTIAVKKRTLVLLASIGGGVLLCSLLVSAFLLGRSSAPGHAASGPSAAPREGTAPGLAEGVLPSGRPEPISGRRADLPQISERSASEQVPAVASPTPNPSDPVLKEAVRSYFQAVDEIQPGELGEDKQGLAQNIVGAAINGDLSGLDRLVRQIEDSEDKLAALSPPSVCQDFHKEAQTVVAASKQVLLKLKSAFSGADPAALQSLTAMANQLAPRADALQAKERAIKLAYGIQ